MQKFGRGQEGVNKNYGAIPDVVVCCWRRWESSSSAANNDVRVQGNYPKTNLVLLFDDCSNTLLIVAFFSPAGGLFCCFVSSSPTTKQSNKTTSKSAPNLAFLARNDRQEQGAMVAASWGWNFGVSLLLSPLRLQVVRVQCEFWCKCLLLLAVLRGSAILSRLQVVTVFDLRVFGAWRCYYL